VTKRRKLHGWEGSGLKPGKELVMARNGVEDTDRGSSWTIGEGIGGKGGFSRGRKTTRNDEIKAHSMSDGPILMNTKRL